MYIEPTHQKTYLRTCVPSEYSSAQLIRIFTERILIDVDAYFLHADNKDSCQTVRMRRLI